MIDPELARFAVQLADAARTQTLARLAAAPDDKGGREYDPVTEADRAAERAMRALIEAEYPDHGVAGEEYGARAGAGRYVWSLDPIDGTRAFVCGLPTWVTLIALLEAGAPVLGVIDAPMLGERYVGDGVKASLGDRAIRTSGCTALAYARLSTTDPFLFDAAGVEGFDRLRRAAKLTRYGLDGYGYARLAAGTIDLVVEAGLKQHDWAALVPIVRGAGGAIGNWRGGDDLSGGDVVAAASGALLDEAVAILQSSPARGGGPA